MRLKVTKKRNRVEFGNNLAKDYDKKKSKLSLTVINHTIINYFAATSNYRGYN